MMGVTMGRIRKMIRIRIFYLSGRNRVVFRIRVELEAVCVLVVCFRSRCRRRDAPAAGRFDDDAGDARARRREDVDSSDAGEKRREVGFVFANESNRIESNRIVDASDAFIHSFIHSFIVSLDRRWERARERGSVIATGRARTSRHAAE